MKTNTIFAISAIALLSAACSDKNGIDVDPIVNPTPGKDVVFGVDIASGTRTIYGPENTTDKSFPIYWLNDDRLMVFSPQCSPGSGEYAVEIAGATAESAGQLKVKGDHGVQWTEAPTADFYSVYPYGQIVDSDVANRKVTMRMPHIQDDYIHEENGTYTSLADMKGGFLYAQTPAVPNGSVVQLGYKPFSTAVRFRLQGPAGGSADDNVQIQSITLRAPEGVQLAGNVDVTFGKDATSQPVITPRTPDGTDSYNYVIVYSSYEAAQGGGYITLKKGESIELNAFVIIGEETDITSEWTLEVRTISKTYTKKLGGTAMTGKNSTLIPGQIHRLPDLPPLDADNVADWDVSDWMTNIPRNTYLCEISVPGSWNSMNGDFQQGATDATDLTTQYNSGARAFHLDTRWKDTSTLGIAAGDSHNASGTGWDKTGKLTNGSDFATALSTITGNVKSDEYMVVLCTFAQGSAVPSGKTWEQAVSTACANNTLVYDGSKITPQTTVGDVLGKVIVICNSEGTTPSGLTDSKCLFVNAPLTLSQDIFSATPPYKEDVIHFGGGKASAINMIVSQCQTEFKSFSANNLDYTTQTQGTSALLSSDNKRGYLPDNAERLRQLNAVLQWSSDNYKGGGALDGADRMIYLGIGGITGGYTARAKLYGAENNPGYIAGEYGPWIYNKIQDMVNKTTNYYPVGIVLMNNVVSTESIGTSGTTDLTGPAVMKQILLLNNRYQKAYDKSKPAWPTTTTTRGTKTRSTANGWD